MPTPELQPATLAVVTGRPDRADGAPVNPPVVLSSTYVGHGVPPGDVPVYTRLGTETWLPLEEALAGLERAALPGLVFSSGMAAISAVLDLVEPGTAVVIPRHAYHAALVAARRLERYGVRVVEVDIADTAAVVAALQDSDVRASVLWVESPTNPMLEIADLPALVPAAHAAGAIVVVDNTFATPLGQRPLTHGADVVVHSVTKYLAGHSDVVLGAALTNDPGLHAQLRERRSIGGGIAGPWEAWLALRGLRTLSLRVERSQASALELARRLAAHPDVVAVNHPGLPSHPEHERARTLMDGFGSILTLRPRGGAAGADALAAAVRLWVPATSLGGVESSLERRRRFASEAPTVPEDLLRLSVGIEDVEDLWADLDQALRRIG
ncbi:trans-sulfuration enzyme family protein [Georgenia faecalis]|uniref:Trans-sulfuration enzyme family protein n=1 Tax=Georgenia faecalis TaxID=2483799 RepID=A0ABV9DA03_9MICO|nr:aminotransferase class I/II-fold pyridoxal phosphate-dependent enzyme [Georgenia faecalis]